MSNSTIFYAVNPRNNERLNKPYTVATLIEINEKVNQASKAFSIYRKKGKDEIANFLDQAAEEIMNLGDDLLEVCNLETALPLGRLQGERGRTVNQLKLFASVVREGSWVDARIDTALPDRTPVPKPDIRHMLVPLGPVAVFGASNFPLAFSVGGGDTASALAAGCPVIVKAHPAHPQTSEMVASAFLKAAAVCQMPEGIFSLVQGNTNFVGETLVKHPKIKAVGFTGSYRGGMALFDLAQERLEPIPVFSEMGSTNPVFILPNALKENTEQIASGMVGSISMGAGQFCTSPGLAFVQAGDELIKFNASLAKKMEAVPAGTLLTSGIKNAYEKGIKNTSNLIDVEDLASGKAADNEIDVQAKFFSTSIKGYHNNKDLSEENFGPSSIVVKADNKEELLSAAKQLRGHLTATVHGTAEDLENYKDLLNILENKVGRILLNGYPTGVEVCDSMVHGGPFPATTAPQSTSVGTNAIKRFVRPLCFQNYPNALLSAALQDENPLKIWRLVNGKLTQDSIK